MDAKNHTGPRESCQQTIHNGGQLQKKWSKGGSERRENSTTDYATEWEGPLLRNTNLPVWQKKGAQQHASQGVAGPRPGWVEGWALTTILEGVHIDTNL